MTNSPTQPRWYFIAAISSGEGKVRGGKDGSQEKQQRLVGEGRGTTVERLARLIDRKHKNRNATFQNEGQGPGMRALLAVLTCA